MKRRPIRITFRSALVAGTFAGAALLAVPAAAAVTGHGQPYAGPSTPVTVAGTALAQSDAPGGRGAQVPFTEYEAENAHTTGRIVGPSRAFTQLAAEASGRRAVALTAGQSIDFVLAKPANAVDVRFAIPDGPDEALHVSANGQTLPDLTLTAAYSHVYGNYPFTNSPSDGGEHHYFDDVRTLLGATYPAGSDIRLTATGDAVIDLADFEVATAKSAPAGYLSVTDFGADPSGATDSSDAIQAAIAAGESREQGVWIPAGTYTVTRQLVVDHVTVTGAGPWFSVLRGPGVGVFGNAPANGPSTSVHLSDFAIFGATTIRNDQVSDSGLGGALGGGSTVDDLWIEHTKVGAWFDGPVDGLTITNTRIQDTMADGINLHDGVSHVTVANTFVRNTGDDGMAMWSDQNADHDNTFVHDTVSVPVLANGLAIYGGYGNAITDDIASDSVTQGGGVHVGNRFGSVPLSGTTTITGDLLIRDGNLVPNDPTEIGALWFEAADEPMDGTIDVSHDTLLDSSYAGIQFDGPYAITNVHIDHVAISGAGTYAFQLQGPGSASVSDVTAAGLGGSAHGHLAGTYDCASGFALTQGHGNSGWNGMACGFPPANQLEIAQAAGVNFGFQSLGSTTTQPIAITNPGPEPVTITAVTPPTGFTVPNTCPTIAVGATCTLQAVFTPSASANYTGLLTIDSSSSAGPYVVQLAGVGFDPNGDLALGRTATSSSETSDYYGPQRLVDGDTSTYFESQDGTFPQTATVDLGQPFSVDRIVLTLPPGWGARTETIAVSADGQPLVAAAGYLFDPDAGNAVTITFPAVDAETLTLTFTGNDGWPAAQISEFEVFAH